jgi:3-phenylpropionate/cinnamic acid dioxygenase small subunit
MASMTLQEIADRLEIEELLTRYATALDRKDWDLYASCFTSDAYIDYTSAGGIKGRLAVIKPWLAGVMAGFPMSQHLITNRAITIDGDTATCESYFFNPMGLADEAGELVLFFEGGSYSDKLVRTAEGWRIAQRIEQTAYSSRLNPVIALPITPEDPE